MLTVTYIEARDIPDAWFQCISKVQEVGFRYEIQQGSFVGETRLEFDFAVIQISHPYAEPYDSSCHRSRQTWASQTPLRRAMWSSTYHT